jgi:DNA-binding MarR family transcriptional regulator
MLQQKDDSKMVTAFRSELGKEAFIAAKDWGTERSRYFLSEMRQKIFQKLCDMPCITVDYLAREMGMHPSSVRWHTGKLLKGGFVGKRPVRGSLVFYPEDLMAEDEIELVSFIQKPVPGKLFRSAIASPGLTQKELSQKSGIRQPTSARYLKSLEQAGLLTHVEDGKFKRYYATDRILRLYSSRRKKMRQFRENMLKRLRREMFSIEILRSTPDLLSLKLSTGSRSTVLTIPVNPYRSFLTRQ